jgi:hypothetical protein
MTIQTMLPRGIRNNNPLNIRLVAKNRWQGRVPPKHNSDGAFEQFHDPIMGLRAAAVLLIAHYDRRHLDTIRKLVAVWAPLKRPLARRTTRSWASFPTSTRPSGDCSRSR